MLRVVIAEPLPNVAEAIRRTMAALPEVEVAGEARDAASTLLAVAHELPDVVVLDGALVHRYTRDLVTLLKRASPGLKVFILADYPGQGYEEAAAALGADFLILKVRLVDELPPAFEALRRDLSRAAANGSDGGT